MPYDTSEKFRREFALNLKRARKTRKMTQADLAWELGMHQRAVSTYETGRSLPSLETARKISNILAIDINILIPMCW